MDVKTYWRSISLAYAALATSRSRSLQTGLRRRSLQDFVYSDSAVITH